MFDALVGIALVLNAVGICVLLKRVGRLEGEMSMVHKSIGNLLRGLFHEQHAVELLMEHIFGKKGPDDR